MFLRGADVGLDGNAEDIDAIALDSDGRLVISTLGRAHVPGANGELVAQDEDLLVLNGDHWELLLDGSDMGLDTRNEDIAAAWIDAQGFALSTLLSYSIPGLSGGSDDVFRCRLTSTSENTQADSCTLLFDSGSDAIGFGGQLVDAFSIRRAGTEGTPNSDNNGDDPVGEAPEHDDVTEPVYLPLVIR